jgi:mycofactocin glycosyltransferase
VTPLPEGFGLELDRSVRRFAGGGVVVGGHPGRLITLSPDGVDTLAGLLAGQPASTIAERRLAGRLVTAGMAHPRRAGGSAPSSGARSVTVVVPARDRTADLDRCLGSLRPGPPVVVVDDGSADPRSVSEVCERHDARLLRRTVSGGPAAARNDALDTIDTELVAFVDSDCSVTAGWLAPLITHFDDPSIAAVAPRIRPAPTTTRGRMSTAERYSDHRSPLDLGSEPSEVGPERLVRYVPTAALVVRRSALTGGFDPDLRTGEDVDLVWRLLAAGWRVRYEPSVSVHHREPASWRRLLGRRFRYGTSAGPLARRHPGLLAPVDLRPWPAAVALSVLARRPGFALAALAGSTVALHREVGRRGIPLTRTLGWSAGAAAWTLVGVARATTMLAAPALVALAVRNRPVRTTAALVVLGPPALDWWRRRPRLDPLRWALACVADDLAYGTGVWAGCLAAHTFGPLIPSVHTSWLPETRSGGGPDPTSARSSRVGP